MLKPFFPTWVVAVAIAALGAEVVSGQDYPHKPIRIITSEAGGGADFSSRVISLGISGPLGQPVIVENRGQIAIELVSKAPPDGYTLLVAGSNLYFTPLLRKTTYDPAKDFAPITIIVSSPNVLVVHPSLPVKTVKELIAFAKAKPGKLDYSSAGTGVSGHIAMELFKSMAGVDFVHIPYKGGALAANALVRGEVQVTFPNAGAVMPHVKSGRIRALAVASAKPSALTPGLPTVAEFLPGYESDNLIILLAPANTPTAIINRLNEESVRVLNMADVKEKYLSTGVEAVGSSPAALAAKMKSDMAMMGKVIRDAGIKAD